jgi:hypothetical protein
MFTTTRRPTTRTAPVPQHPALLPGVVRLGAALLVLLALTRPTLVQWAEVLAPRPRVEATTPALLAELARQQGTAPASPLARLPARVQAPVVQITRFLNDQARPLDLAAAGILAVVLLDLTQTAGSIVGRWHTARRQRRRVLTIRPLRPQNRVRVEQRDPADFWQALHPALIPLQRQRVGVALTLHATPNQPVHLGAVLTAPPQPPREPTPATPALTLPPGTERTLPPIPVPPPARGTTDPLIRARQALVSCLVGQDAETVVDDTPDTLADACTGGRIVLTQDYRLNRPPHHPLRTPDDATSDLLGTLAGALRCPAGVVASELQVRLQPRQYDDGAAWRVYAQRLRARGRLLTAEVAALDSKLAAPAFDVTVRAVVIAQNAAAVAAARAALTQLTGALGSLHARHGLGVQRLIPLGGVRQVAVGRPNHGGTLLATLPGLLLALTLVGLGYPWPLALVLGLLLALLGMAGATVMGRMPLALVLARSARPCPTPILWPPRFLPRPPAILSSTDGSGLWHLPAASLGQLIAWQPHRVIPTPAPLFVPEGASDWVQLGNAQRSDGVWAPVGFPLQLLTLGLHVVASVGAGKTRGLLNLVRQCLPGGCIVGDGKADDDDCLLTQVQAQIPLSDEGRLLLLDARDAAWPIGLDPFAHLVRGGAAGATTTALGAVLDLLVRLDGDARESPGLREFAEQGAALLPYADEPGLPALKHLLEDERYRAILLQRCANGEVVQFWQAYAERPSETQRQSLLALIRRLNTVLTDETTRYLVTLQTVDLLAALDDGAIVLLPLPHRTLKGQTPLIGMLMLQALTDAAFRRGGTALGRRTVPVIFDEAHKFFGAGYVSDLADLITQVRSRGLGLVYAHQTLNQLGKLQDAVLTNVQHRLLLATQEPDAATLAAQYPHTDLTAADLIAQPPDAHQYLSIKRREGPSLCSVRPLPWPAPLEVAVPAYDGPPWQTVLPPPLETADGDSTALDTAICALVYGDGVDVARTSAALARTSAALARLSAAQWALVMQRWQAIRTHQRQHILAQPGCIPDRRERQQWLSRLYVAMPRVLAEATYQRLRGQGAGAWADAPTRPRTGGRTPAPPLAGVDADAPVPVVGLPTSLDTLLAGRPRRRGEAVDATWLAWDDAGAARDGDDVPLATEGDAG